MTIEEYKKLPFKYDGEGKPVLVEEEWSSLSRRVRRFIERELKKGKVPNFIDFLYRPEED